MEFFDTHCHIHEIVRRITPVHDKWIKGGVTDIDAEIAGAAEQDVTRAICVGTTTADSALVVECVEARENLWASIGIHPHEAEAHLKNAKKIEEFKLLAQASKVVAVGECGLDFYYNHSPKEAQIDVLKMQLDVAQTHRLPVIFHVRDAFDDFWPIFDAYSDTQGVIHSFTATKKELEAALERGLYIGLNGIMTFTKNQAQLAAAKAVPLDKMLLETDAPFLTPAPYRGTICQLKHVRVTAEFLAGLRGETIEEIAAKTTANAQKLFNIA